MKIGDPGKKIMQNPSMTVSLLSSSDSSLAQNQMNPNPNRKIIQHPRGEIVWDESSYSPKHNTDCWALWPRVCYNLPTNWEQPGAVYGSLALKAPIFLSLRTETDLRF